MKKPSGRFEVVYASGREETLTFKTFEGKDFKELKCDLERSKELGAIKEFTLKLGKAP